MKTALSTVLLLLSGNALSGNIEWYPVHSNPGEDLYAVASNGDETVAVGAAGTVLISNFPGEWGLIDPLGEPHWGKHELDLRFVTLESEGSIRTGGDYGLFGSREATGSWRAEERSTYDFPHTRGVAVGEEGRALRIADDGRLLLSHDGGNSWMIPSYAETSDGNGWWPRNTNGVLNDIGFEPAQLTGVTYAWGRFWIVGATPLVWREGPVVPAAANDDLVLYRQMHGDSTQTWRDIVFGDGRLVIGGGPDVRLRSTTDGENWETVRVEGLGDYAGAVIDVDHGEAGWIALTEAGGIAFSRDGEDWVVSPSVPEGVNAVAAGSSDFVAVGQGGLILRWQPDESAWRTEVPVYDEPNKHEGLVFFGGWFFDEELAGTGDYGRTWLKPRLGSLEAEYGRLSGWETDEDGILLRFVDITRTSVRPDPPAREVTITLARSTDGISFSVVSERTVVPLAGPSEDGKTFTSSRLWTAGDDLCLVEWTQFGSPLEEELYETSEVSFVDQADPIPPVEVDGTVAAIERNGDDILIVSVWTSLREEAEVGGTMRWISRYGLLVLESSDGGATWSESRWPLHADASRPLIASLSDDEYLIGLGESAFLRDGSGDWLELTLPSLGNLESAAAGAGIYVLGGSDGRIATSSNLEDWEVDQVTHFGKVESIAYGNGEFLATNGDGRYLHGRTGFWAADWLERNGWFYAPWFGWLFPLSDSAWQWHLEHGWIFNPGSSTAGFWVWDGAMKSWWFTTAGVYPAIYAASLEEWLYYVNDADARLFYSFEEGGPIRRIRSNR